LRTPWSTLRRLPLVLSLGIGLCVNQTRAVIEAMLGRETEFVRTPKPERSQPALQASRS
jgi:hypothetical protein